MTNSGNSLKPQTLNIKNLLSIPWIGLRPDVILYPGPTDRDGQRSFVLEDPVRGNNFRIGYTESEVLFRLLSERDPDAAAANLYATTAIRPSLEEIAAFITMLQRERLAILPKDEVIKQDASMAGGTGEPGLFQQLLESYVFFKLSLLRPDKFLNRTYRYASLLWSPFLRYVYLICGILGVILVSQEIDLYIGSVNYLFTPQGSVAFFFCLALLKTGHEFAHAYTAKSMELHVRSMGIFFIVLWPLLYTDVTDVWKVPDRRQRLKVAAAGVWFEVVVGGVALLGWALLSDGVLRSLMFFLSGTSIASSVFINLNPFMRYDGYYLLMDWWGIDNLRPRAFAMLRYTVRRWLLDWKGAPPEIHPHRRWLILYGILALLYRIFIYISIALAVYYFYSPVPGLILFGVEIWFFSLWPAWIEVKDTMRQRYLIGSIFRVMLTICVIGTLAYLMIIPLPDFERLPCLLLYKGTNRMDAPVAGRLTMAMPESDRVVRQGDLLTRISSDDLAREAEKVKFDLASVRATIDNLGSGGAQGAYRSWLLAEEERLNAAAEKYAQAIAQLEIRAPSDGRLVDINEQLYEGASVAKGAYLFTIANPKSHELKAYIHERLIGESYVFDKAGTIVLFAGPELPTLTATLKEKSMFPVYSFPNLSLFDVAGGHILSVQDRSARKPRDAYFAFTFEVENVPVWLPHGQPSWIWLKGQSGSIADRLFNKIWKSLTERGII